MVILTAKLNKGKLLAALLILAVLIAATILICSGGQPDAAAPADNLHASNNDERVAFLASFGWTVQADPVKMQQVRIPDTASEVFDRYNQLQQSQGFDLAQYAGKTAQQFVYEISNEAQEGPVYATVLVYKETIIGGDVSSAATGGVMHGFART